MHFQQVSYATQKYLLLHFLGEVKVSQRWFLSQSSCPSKRVDRSLYRVPTNESLRIITVILGSGCNHGRVPQTTNTRPLYKKHLDSLAITDPVVSGTHYA